MAWHIIHSLLDMVRTHSTFPGKLWIIMMFIFRILVVARIGDNVYHDEQDQFVCNTLTPGCENVCFNRFSPISQLRFWSLMVLVVSTPGILFCIYATHKIYHATVKFPSPDDDDAAAHKLQQRNWDASSESVISSYVRPPKRKRASPTYRFANHPSAPPLYEITTLANNKGSEKSLMRVKGDGFEMRKRKNKARAPPNVYVEAPDNEKDVCERKNLPLPDHGLLPMAPDEDRDYGNHGYPIYDRSGRRVDWVRPPARVVDEMEQIKINKRNRRMLENPILYRAYWWHVMLRTLLEGGFLFGQYYLYGWWVPELFECERNPCPKVVDCYVSRPMEKTCLLWLMFGLGAVACVLSAAEFWTLGWERLKYALFCHGPKLTYAEKRKQLSRLNNAGNPHSGGHGGHEAGPRDDLICVPTELKTALSFDSLSSETTVESV